MEAYQSAFVIVTALKKRLVKISISPECIQLVSDTSRESAMALMKATGYIDVLIPRSGAGLIRVVIENVIVPVIETGKGIVHIYIDKDADLEKVMKIVKNAKMSRPSVCNVMEGCVVHEAIAPQFLPLLKEKVCSPGGSTIDGVISLEQTGFRSSIIKATRHAKQRTEELGQ